MTSGKRDQRVDVYVDSGTTLTNEGQHIEEWSLVGTRWTEVIGRGGNNFTRAVQMQATSTHLLRMRADSLTKPLVPHLTKFVWRGRRLNPTAGTQASYRDLEIEFECEEAVGGQQSS